MTQLRIEKLTSLTNLVLKPNTLYFVETENSDIVDVYISNADGTSYKHTTRDEDILSKFVTIQPTPPTLPHSRQLWWCNVNGSLYIQYEVEGAGASWVEAIPGISIPQFGGNGTSNLMSRADHTHAGVELAVCEW